MDTVSREVISHKARLAGNGCSLAKRRNTVDDHFSARPKGASQSVQYGVSNSKYGKCLLNNVL